MMKRLFQLTSMVLLSNGLALAQTPVATATNYGIGSGLNVKTTDIMPVPAYSGTPLVSDVARGFSFQAPVSFKITGFSFPNESNQGDWVVGFYNMYSVAPPAWSKTILRSPTYYQTGPKGKILAPPNGLTVTKGDWIGVIGGPYSKYILNRITNSLATPKGPFVSQILGHPVTIIRFINQSSFVTNRGAGFISTEASGPISRVFIHIAGQATPEAGMAPSITTLARPVTGTTASIRLMPGKRHQGIVGGLILGSYARPPFAVSTYYGDVLIGPSFPYAFLVPAGGGTVKAPIPPHQYLWGGKLYIQGMFSSLPANFTMTNGIEWVVGGR